MADPDLSKVSLMTVERDRVFRLAPPGQRHVAGPGIAGAVGSAYEKDGVWVRGYQGGHRGPYQRGIVRRGGMALGQALLEPGEPAGQCE